MNKKNKENMKKKYELWFSFHAAILSFSMAASFAASIATSLTAVGFLALVGRFFSVEILLGVLAPMGAITSALLAYYLGRQKGEDGESVEAE